MEMLKVSSALVMICLLQMDYTKSTQWMGLEYTLDESNLFYPGSRFTNYELFKDIEGFNETEIPEHIRYWFAMYSFCMPEHGGTHMDAPFHFNKDGWKPAEIPLERLIDVRVAVINVEASVFAMADPRNFVLEVYHVEEHERRYGKIPLGGVVLIRTGWDRYWPDKPTYWGLDSEGKFNFPGISPDVAKWFVEERKIVGIGIDTQSIDIGHFVGAPVAHLVLTASQVYILENVANLKDLWEKIVPAGYSGSSGISVESSGSSAGVEGNCDPRLIVLPIKSLGTGGPARITAYCKNST